MTAVSSFLVRMSPSRLLPFWISMLMPVVAAMTIAWGGGWVLAMPILIFGVIPVLDAFCGHDRDNPVPGTAMGVDRFADLALWAWVPVQLMVIGAAVARADAMTRGELWGTAIGVGLVAGAGGINVAHELVHRSSARARGAAELLMTSVGYPHFCIEHVHGHHRNVATPLDPASARRGISVYRFWGQTLVGSLVSAWRIEARRRRGHGSSPWSDRRIRMAVGMLWAWGLAHLIGGPRGLLLFVVQGAVAVLLLETINYVEHYGLRRRRLPDGRYERVQPHHSWNASQRLTNWFLFNLQRHSDHHYLASRPYWALRHHDDVPQLPFGYATALLVALVPPLWRRIMDPRVDRWQ